MKRWLLLFVLTLPFAVAAQNAAVERFYDRYAAAEGVTSVQLEPKMMQLMSRQAAERGDRELSRLLEDIRIIRIVALKTDDREAFVAAAQKAVEEGKFGLVTAVAEEGQTTKFFLRESRLSRADELVMLTYGAKETVVVDICGSFDLEQVMLLSTLRP